VAFADSVNTAERQKRRADGRLAGESHLSVGLASGMLELTLVEQPARYELGGNAEESAEQAADGG
jgi:hypothetical protein